jgi:hypothetical protein
MADDSQIPGSHEEPAQDLHPVLAEVLEQEEQEAVPWVKG